MSNSTRRRKRRNLQSAKPHPDFPLTARKDGRWCKKVRGKVFFFGQIDGPDGRDVLAQAALNKWLDEKDALLAGRVPREKVPEGGVTLRDLSNRFLTYKRGLVDTGELSERTWTEYRATCERLLDTYGKDRLVTDVAPDEFEKLRVAIAKQWGPIRLGNEIQRVRSIFKYAFDADMIEKPVKFGPGFKRPSLKTLRKLRSERGPRLFERDQIHSMLKDDKVSDHLKAMILLGVNCGFGNEDVATLKMSALDLEGGWVSHPRPKTGIDRKCKLWPETIQTLRLVLENRRQPKDEKDSALVFLTQIGQPWSNGTYGSAVTHEMDKLLRRLKIKKARLSFYTLRHTHRTIADGSRDAKACDYIMGHVDNNMSAHYVERIDDSRLEAVAAHVHDWLFPKVAKTKQPKAKAEKKVAPKEQKQARPARPALKLYSEGGAA